jgi:NitT/TauT family transport system substrate-binding protein
MPAFDQRNTSHSACKTRVVFIFFISALFLPVNALAQARQPLLVSYSGINANYLSLWAAMDAGYFTERGLDVQLLHIRGGSTTVQVLLSGQTPIAMVGATPIAFAYLRGSHDLVMISGVTNTMSYVVAARSDVQNPADLKGKRLAVSRFGSTSDFVAEFALKQWKLNRSQVKMLQIGNEADRLAAMQGGDLEAGVFTPTYLPAINKLGMKVLLDLDQLGVPYLLNGYATTRSFIKNNRHTVVGFMAAVLKAITKIKQDASFAEKTLAKYIKTNDSEFLKTALDQQRRALPDFPAASKDSIRTILEDLAVTVPEAKRVAPESLIDSSVLEEARGL